MDRLEAIYYSSRFYIDNFRFTLRLCYILLLLNFVVLGFLYSQYIFRPDPQYFVTTTDGRMIAIPKIAIKK